MKLLLSFTIFLLFTFYFLLFTSPKAEAHTFHTTLTRIDYNTKEKTAEITVQLFTHDLEEILEESTGKWMNFEKTPETERLIFAYLKENWTLKNKKGVIKTLRWVGLKQETDTAWLYVETKMPEGLNGATMQNRMFFELYDDQVNLLIAKDGDKKADLFFKADDKFKELVFRNPTN